jgi:hypothetical protein
VLLSDLLRPVSRCVPAKRYARVLLAHPCPSRLPASPSFSLLVPTPSLLREESTPLSET